MPHISVSTEDCWGLIDPELIDGLRRTIDALNRSQTGPVLSGAEILPGTAPLSPPALQAVERLIPGPGGQTNLRLLVIDPPGSGESRPAMLHTHGGGFTEGTARLTRNLQRIAQACSCVVVSVDYRLAPANPFPDALDDNYAALQWLYRSADELNVDRTRIAVGGESAGGGHAAMLAIVARDRGEIPLCYQWLIYPMLDDRTGSSCPVPSHVGRFIWTSESNQLAWTSFLGVEAGSAAVPTGVIPARLEQLAGLPPAYIGVGSLDLFVDEDIEYARRLTAEGVPVELHVVPGAYHGFDLIASEAAVSRRFTRGWLEALNKAFACRRPTEVGHHAASGVHPGRLKSKPLRLRRGL